MVDETPTILRGADGSPQHVVLTWEAFQALQGQASGQVHGQRERSVPAAIRQRQTEGVAPVRAWREHLGLSQAELARRIGISRAYLAQIETGERTGTVEVLARAARSLGCLIEDLIHPSECALAAK